MRPERPAPAEPDARADAEIGASLRARWQCAFLRALKPAFMDVMHSPLKAFLWLYTLPLVTASVGFFVFATVPAGIVTIDVGVVFVLLLLGYRYGLPIGAVVHLGSAYAAAHMVHDALLSGGIFSPSIGWLAVFPVAPLIVKGVRASVAWLLISIACVGGVALATWAGLVPGTHDATLASGWWALSNYALICTSLLVLPAVYEHGYHRLLAQGQQRQRDLLDKQAALLRAQSHQDHFISELSHELRTPMNAILGFNDLLAQRPGQPERAQAVLALVRQSADHLLTVINDILDYSQMQTGQLVVRHEPFALAATVQAAFGLFAPRVGSMKIDYQLVLDPGLPETVLGDRHRLMQILVNLLGNALKFTHRGSVSLHLRCDGEELLFTVQDTGIGVDSAHHAKIFNRFEQATPQTATLYGGNGLGLAISQHLVALLGGRIGVQSDGHSGSRFWFCLPLVCGETAPARREAAALSAALSAGLEDLPLRILVVDDSPVNLMLAGAVVLARWPKARIHEAEHGQAALALLRTEPFDLVLMDMIMPVLDGIAATQQLRTTLPAPQCHTPVLALTANINPQDHARCLAVGMNGVVLKPFDRHQLYAQMEALLLASPEFLRSHKRQAVPA